MNETPPDGPASPHQASPPPDAIEREGRAFGARTRWSANGASFFTVVTVLLGVIASLAFQAITFALSRSIAGGEAGGPERHMTPANAMLAMLVMQLVIIALTLWGAGLMGDPRRQVLSLPATIRSSHVLTALAALLMFVVPYNALLFWLWPETFASDLRLFTAFTGSDLLWLTAVVVVVGAPVSEELLFRGFLFPALAKARHGLPGAAFLSTAGWTMLHFNYTIAGLIEVFAIGLIFCWIVQRTGNLWITILLHALYNGIQLAMLAVWPRLLGL